MTQMKTRYVVITPVRNEEAHLPFTIESVTHQSLVPEEWIIVDDGSTDNTGSIIDESVSRFSWIRAVRKPDRGFRKSGGGVVEAFNAGYVALGSDDWDFIVKLDGDLAFQPDYFEKCFEWFDREPRLGVGGGVIYNVFKDGREEFEPGPDFHVRGATKIYRRACWKEIGGFWPAPGWDTIDEVKANMLGWTSRSFPDLVLKHQRPTGAADGCWRDFVKNGASDYISGYHPLFMLAKCMWRLLHRPYLVGAAGLAYGFISSSLRRVPKVDDPELIKYVRREQMAKLRGGRTVWQ